MRDDELATWRHRFIVINLVRIGATLLVLFALVLWQSSLIVPGGSIIGLPLALIGVLASFIGPRALAHRWRTPPEP